MKLRYRLVQAEGARIEPAEGTKLEAEGARGRMAIHVGDARVAGILTSLNREDVSELELNALAASIGGESLQFSLRQCLSALKRLQAISYEVHWQGSVLASVLPLTTRALWDRLAGKRPEPLVFSRHSYFRPGAHGLCVVSPLAYAEVIVSRHLAGDLVAQSCGSVPRQDMVGPSLTLLFNILEDTGHLANTDGQRSSAPYAFHDLIFHSASRLGRVWGAFGRNPNPDADSALRAPCESGPVIELRQVGAGPVGANVSFTTVLNLRRSRRYPGLAPLTLAQIAAFLSLAAEPKNPDASADTPHYPYPSGGGIYRFHIYVVVRRCTNLAPGLYEYIAEDHALRNLRARPERVDALAAQCGEALGTQGFSPDAVIVITADIGAFIAKYDAIAYRLVLLGAGCLIQSMYLAASALRLSGCAVGGGSPDLFAQEAGADLWREPSIVEFALSAGPP